MENDYEDYNYKPTTHHHTIHTTTTTTNNNPSSHHHEQAPPSSTSDLMSSAQYLAGAARYAFSHETDKIDKPKAAEAAADLVAAAKQYGHLEEKSFGKYFDQAETYLHKYGSHSSGTTGAAAAGVAEAEAAARPTGHKHQAAAEYEDEDEESTGGGDGGGGYGDYMKMAQGLLKKF
ncbi:Nodulin-related protein [Drosera capensis]